MTTEQDILKAIESLDRQLTDAVEWRDAAAVRLAIAEGRLTYYRNAIQALRKQLIEQEAVNANG